MSDSYFDPNYTSAVPAQANFAPQSGGKEAQVYAPAAVPVKNGFTAQAIGDDRQGESIAQPLNNEAMNHKQSKIDGQDEVQATSAPRPISKKVIGHKLSNTDSSNKGQVDSPPRSPNRFSPGASYAEKHARYAAEYLNYEDSSSSESSDDESSDSSKGRIDLFNSTFPPLNRMHIWQLPQGQRQSSNLKPAYIVPPELARIKDPTKRHVRPAEPGSATVAQTASASGSASHPIIVDDASQHSQGPSANQPSTMAVSQASQSIQHQANISNPKKRIKHPDSDDDEQPSAGVPKRVKRAKPIARRQNVAKSPKQSPKLRRTQNTSFRQQLNEQLFQYPIPPLVQQTVAPSVQQSSAPPVQDPNLATAPPQTPSGELQYTGRAQYEQATANRPIKLNWMPPQSDASFPKDLAHYAMYIKMLVGAFQNTEDCIDPGDVPAFEDRWVLPGAPESTIIEQKLETVSWKLLEMAVALHIHGSASLETRDEVKLEKAYKNRTLTFSQRIDQICELLRLSKARCEKVLKFEDLDMVVAAPEPIANAAKVNKQQNDGRQKYLEAGREAKKEKEKEEEAAPPMYGQERHEKYNQLAQEDEEAEFLLQRSTDGRKLKEKIQAHRDDEQEQSEKQVVEPLSQMVEAPAQDVEVPSQVHKAPPQVFEPTPSDLFEPDPSDLFEQGTSDLSEQGAFQLFDDEASEREFFEMIARNSNIVPPQDLNPAIPQTINSTRSQPLGFEPQESAQRFGDAPPQFVAAEQQNGPQQFVQPPSNNNLASNVPEQHYFSPVSREPAIIDPALLFMPSPAAWSPGNEQLHGQQAHFQFEELTSKTKPHPPVDPSFGDKQLNASTPQDFAALQQYNQQMPEYQNMQQQPVNSNQIYHGGNMYVQASSVGAGPMPLATNVGAEDQPLRSNTAEHRVAKRSRDVEEESNFPHAQPAKRQNRGQ